MPRLLSRTPYRDDVTSPGRQTSLTAWRTVVGFGIVSLAGDVVYEGGRSVYGPALGALGASALVVGVVTGAGEAAALVLRIFTGPLADRTGNYWPLTIIGYAMTGICVPLIAIAPKLGAAGLVVASALILLERTGKAVRSPSKTTLLAAAADKVGTGKGFGVHKSLDEIGAFLGPLLVAGMIAWSGYIWPGLAILAIPGAFCVLILLWLRGRQPAPSRPAGVTRQSWWASTFGAGLGRTFFLFAFSAAAATAGLVTFGIISFHLAREHVVALAVIPVVYAGAQLASGLAALVSGFGFDRVGGRVLLALPVLVVIVPVLAFTKSVTLVVLGVAAWGAANGLQDSTVKALVSRAVPRHQLATAYGVFAAIQGSAAVVGGAVAGWLYEVSIPLLVVVVAATQVVALVLLVATLHAEDTQPAS